MFSFYEEQKLMRKRLIAILFIAAVAVQMLASCGSNQDSKENPMKSADETLENGGKNGEEILKADLPDVNYNGYTFNILVSGNGGLGSRRNDFHAEEETGDVINDARYIRNTTVEEKYGIKLNDIEINGANEGYTALRKTVMSGDKAYDSAIAAGYATSNLAMEGLLSDLNSIEYIDLSKPWWDQKANKDLTIQGKMFYTTGDISTVNNDATYCILFNKKLATDYAVGDLYGLAREGKWTIDKFAEITSLVSADLNGDGLYDNQDLYGALIWDDTMMGIVNATGEKCATITANGEIVLTLFSDKVLSMFDKYTAVVYNKSIAYTYQREVWNTESGETMFRNDQALFNLKLLSTVADMRNMDTDFGILPYPKYDELQTEYYHTVGSWHSMFLCVPAGQTYEEFERTGVILEALAAESRSTLRPAYYEISLKGKYSRDEESLDMLDLILSTRTYDVGWFYEVGSYNEEIMNLLRNFKSNFTSMYEKREAVANKKIAQINEAFEKILD